MHFGFIYTAEGLVVYDVCREDGGAYVASLSVDPRVHFSASSPEVALARLLSHLGVHGRRSA